MLNVFEEKLKFSIFVVVVAFKNDPTRSKMSLYFRGKISSGIFNIYIYNAHSVSEIMMYKVYLQELNSEVSNNNKSQTRSEYRKSESTKICQNPEL